MLEIQLLGEVRVVRDGKVQPLPRSRKTRGLLAYLALSPQRQRRETLCEMFWDTPDDPRAALRWSLSKLRPTLAENGETVLSSNRESVALDRGRASVDVLELRARLDGEPQALNDRELGAIASRFSGSGLEDLDGAGTRRFDLWLGAERRAIDDLHRLVLDELLARESLPRGDRRMLAARRAALNPLDDTANVAYLRLVAEESGLSEARELLEQMQNHYRAENQPANALADAWQQLRQPRVEVTPAEHRLPVEPSPVPAAGPALPDKPSLAILDFADLGSHADSAILARGLVVDLTSRLAQLPGLFVIARQSAARVSAMQGGTRETGARLGVRYLVGGSTQRDDRRVRTTVRLTDATEGAELWSDHFDYQLDDIFAVQDEITDAVIAAIEPAIERAEMARALIKPPGNLSAWELFHRGLWHCFRFTAKDNEDAHRFFKRAISLDPQFARAHAGLSFTHYARAFLHSGKDAEAQIREALDASTRSIGFDSREAMGHWSLGRALFLSRRHDEALMAIDHALGINPNYAQGHYAKGFIGIHAGLDEQSMAAIEHAQRLSPYDPLLFAMKSSRAISLANRGKYDEAAAWAIQGTQEANAHFHIYAIAAACLELAGRSNDASDNAHRVLDRRPDYTIEHFRHSFPHKQESTREALVEALVRAGIPRGNSQ